MSETEPGEKNKLKHPFNFASECEKPQLCMFSSWHPLTPTWAPLRPCYCAHAQCSEGPDVSAGAIPRALGRRYVKIGAQSQVVPFVGLGDFSGGGVGALGGFGGLVGGKRKRSSRPTVDRHKPFAPL